MKREARKCRGKKCNKKKKGAKKGKKGKASRGKTVQQRKINNNKKKGKKTKSDRRRQRQRKTKAKKGQKNKNKNKNKEKQERKTLKEKKSGSKNFGEGRQITGNATSCAMKAIKYARIFEGKATSISRQVNSSQDFDDFGEHDQLIMMIDLETTVIFSHRHFYDFIIMVIALR